MKTIELTCGVCGNTYKKPLGEYKRNEKLGRPSYCSLRCTGKANFKNIPAEKVNRTNIAGLKPSNRLDEYSPFRWHLKNAKQRTKEVDLSLSYLKELWECQQGVCPITGWQLKNMPNTNHVHQLPLTPDRASLDRIDSRKGYVQGNVRYVAVMAQFCKHVFNDEQLLDFCESVVHKKTAEISSHVTVLRHETEH